MPSAYDFSIIPEQINPYAPITASNLSFGTPGISNTQPIQPQIGFFNPNNTGLGWNANTLNFGLQGLNTLGSIWGAYQSNKLAKDQLNFTKQIANANLNNQIKSYNTALEDRSRARAAVEGQTSAEAQAYVDKNRLSR